jgi:hypothetical protein
MPGTHRIPLSLAVQFEPLAKQRGVSRVARGEQRSTQTNGGFLQAAKRVNGSVAKLKQLPVRIGAGQTWWQRRCAFCARHSSQQRAQREPSLERSGPYAGLPTRRELAMIMWMCSSIPPNKLRQIARSL